MIDIQDSTRRDDAYVELNKIIDSISNLCVFPALTWVYVWDIVKDKLDYYSVGTDEMYTSNPKLSEKNVFDMFWEDADKNAFSLEYGVEFLHERVQDWMTDRDILIDNDLTEDNDLTAFAGYE
jgi:hypothetical protein